MKIEALWLSQQGTRTPDNRDHGGLATRSGELLGIVVDGSTAGKTSGDYARAIVKMVIDWFEHSRDEWSVDLGTQALRDTHQALRGQFRKGSASVLLFHLTEKGTLAILHSGDCVIGELKSDIVWLSAPHTFANALFTMPIGEIAKSPVRHLLTQSFRTREYMPPDVHRREIASGTFVIATDGFWAELSAAEQLAFAVGRPSAGSDRDDRSVLLLQISSEAGFTTSLDGRSSPNIHSRLSLV